MTFDLLHLLAQAEERTNPLPAIIFFLIWGLISLIGWWQKRQEKMRQEQQSQVPPPPPPPVPQQRPRAQPQQRVDPQRRPQMQRQEKRPQPQQQRRIPPVTPPAPPPRRAEPVIEVAPVSAAGDALARAMAAEISDAAPRPKQMPAVTATELRGMLEATNLRRIYIVTEILQPPMGLRQQQA